MFTTAMLRRRLKTFDRLLLPPLCAFCRTTLRGDERGMCEPCRLDLPANEPCCPACAEPLAANPGAAPCARCQAKPLPVETVVAPLRYAFPVDRAIQALKFRSRLEFVPVFSTVMTRALEAAAIDVDGVVPVPLHWSRHALRGFNQATELARPVATVLGLRLVPGAVRRRRTLPQSGLDAGRRRNNLRGAFDVPSASGGAHLLIVDDVMTTGATVIELARALRAAGAGRVSVLVAARAQAKAQPGVAKV